MGTIVYNASSGGYYEIVADNGIRYDPVSLSNYPVHEGMHVYFEGEPVRNLSYENTRGIPLRISVLGEYVPPGETAKITLRPVFP